MISDSQMIEINDILRELESIDYKRPRQFSSAFVARCANFARQKILEITTLNKSGHLAGSFSCIDIIMTLYSSIMIFDPGNPGWGDRDRFVLSKGHAAPAFYTALAFCGYLPVSELITLRRINSRLQGHPDSKKLPGVEISTGSLGLGFSAAVGMALGLKVDSKKNRVFALLGDGECDEGSVWEAAMFANHYDLKNITAIIDRNCYQIDGQTEKVMKLEPFADKWKAFGWEVSEINGHDYAQIYESLRDAAGKRRVIIANTIKGAGVSFLENNNAYHSKPCDEVKCQEAVEELNRKVCELL
ncbi:MAG: transketolase [Actinobacteria bacterium]|nr:transketolase [Actinomycetota bacterium]